MPHEPEAIFDGLAESCALNLSLSTIHLLLTYSMRAMLALNVSVKYFVRSRMHVTIVDALGHSVDDEGAIR